MIPLGSRHAAFNFCDAKCVRIRMMLTMEKKHPPRPFQVMAKPIGPICNLDCTYCYYTEKTGLYADVRDFRMSDDVMDAYIKQTIDAQMQWNPPEIWFAWQGGEPTLLGVDYFKRVLEIQRRHTPDGKTVRNALQTNGTRIDAEWATFFAENKFLIGLSIDGPARLHDTYRLDRQGKPSHADVERGFRTLIEARVEVNTLSVVNRTNVQEPLAVYHYLKEIGATHMQFIPLVERMDADGVLADPPEQDGPDARYKVTPWSVRAVDYGLFLSAIFDEWVRKDVSSIFVQHFDVQVGLWAGMPAGLCWFAETCGEGMAIEHNGDLYACDHYVYPAYKLGNIMDQPMEGMARSDGQRAFGLAKRDTLPKTCLECPYKFACNGGCPKHRFVEMDDGGTRHNYLCPAYTAFFSHAGPALKTIAELVRSGRPASQVMDLIRSHEKPPKPQKQVKPRRNDPCPCGSGKKYKKCCGSIG